MSLLESITAAERLSLLVAVRYTIDNYDDFRHRHINNNAGTVQFEEQEYTCAPSLHKLQKLVALLTAENT